MDIIFAENDRSRILHLPIIPETIEIEFPHNNMVFSTISGGDIYLLGMPGLKSVSFSSWMPMKPYPFAKSKVLATEGKEYFVDWKRERKPFRMIIINNAGRALHNELYAIEQFNFGYDRAGDMTYTLQLKQYVIGQVIE